MKKLIVMLLALTVMLSAAIVDISRAQKVAENYYQNYAPTAAKGNVVQKILTKEYLGQPTWYVVKFTEGFVIVAAEDNVRPILGYSSSSPIDEDLYNMQNPFNMRFSAYDKQIVHVVREENMIVKAEQSKWKDIENNIFAQTSSSKATKGPLLQTTWSQGYPFDEQVPNGTPVGCVATAMHQIMRFHQGPSAGNGSNTYTDDGFEHSVNFGAQTYDWGLMQTLNGSVSGQDEVDECSKMAYHLGVSVNMDYDASGSGAQVTDALIALENNWSFHTDANFRTLGSITDISAYSAEIVSDIDNDWPMEFAGFGADGGHAYVLDGYNVDTVGGIYQYAFNWGWGGAYNGWYQLDDLSPGTSDFSLDQQALFELRVDGLLLQMPPPTNIGGSVSAIGDITLTWNTPGVVDPMGTPQEYMIYRDNVLIGSTGTLTNSYVDIVRPEGSYEYLVRCRYTDPDGESLPTDPYVGQVIADPNYPVPVSMAATSYLYNRSKIDIAWTKPFIGNVAFETYFETEAGTWEEPDNVVKYGSAVYPPTSWISYPQDANHQGWRIINADAGFPEWIFQGTQSSFCNGGTTDASGDFINNAFEYMFTPVIVSAGTASIDMYTYTYPDNDLYIVTYSGDFTGDPSSQITELTHIVGVTEGWNNFNTNVPAGTFRVGIIKVVNEVNLSIVDNIIIGADTYPDGDQPTGYEIYRNGSLAYTVGITGPSETYEDNGFVDGYNEYYVRALYAGANFSIASNPAGATIDANPSPGFLAGAYDVANAEVDLAWYAPGHIAPSWFGIQFESDAWDYFDNNDPAGDYYGDSYSKNRTYYNAGMFNMAYPVYIDSLAAAFYEPEVNYWAGDDQFKIAIGTGYGNDAVYLETSDWLTADPEGYYVIYGLLTPQTITEDWFVEVQPENTLRCIPSQLDFIHELGVWEEGPTSFFYEAAVDSWWYMTYNEPYEYFDWAFLCYGYNDEPTITKDGTSNERVEIIAANRQDKKSVPLVQLGQNYPKGLNNKTNEIPLQTNDSKGLVSYNVYKDAGFIANTTNKYYTDDVNPGGDYYITAIYVDEPGESGASNIVTVTPPAEIAVPATITEAVAPDASAVRTFNIENTGIGSLNYDIAFEYVEQMTAEAEAHNSTFDTDLDGYTAESDWVWNSGAAYIVDGGTADLIGSVTSPEFDGTGCTTFEFDHVSNLQFKNANGSDLWVEYTLDGSSWIEVYSQSAATNLSGHLSYNLPSVSTTMKVRFRVNFSRRSTSSVSIDNVRVFGDELVLIEPWFGLASAPSGTVLAGENFDFPCNYDAAGKLEGSAYHVNVTITSNAVTDPVVVIPVTFNVETGGAPIIPAVPANVVTSIVAGDLVIDWDVSADATGYAVYSSDDPYGTFVLVGPVGTEQYTVAADQAKLFYYIIATNGTKTASKTIEVVKSVKSVK